MNQGKPIIKIVTAVNLCTLEEAINQHFAEDWQLYGYIFPIHMDSGAAGFHHWAQAMTRLQWTAKPNPFTESRTQSSSIPVYEVLTK